MGRMIVIYRTPADPAAFDEHYFNVHVPLAKNLPGLRDYKVSKRPIMSAAGDAEPYLIATLDFESFDAMRDAFATPEGRACAKDRKVLAPNNDDLQMYLFDTQTV